MIRNNQQIFGEVNNPNTVTTTDTLTEDMLILGAGNKSVKVYNPGIKHLIFTDSFGKISSISYNQPNKLIGTDSSNNIVLYDLPVIGQLGGTQAPVQSCTVTVVSSASSGAASITNVESGQSVISRATGIVDTGDEITLDITFTNPVLELTEISTVGTEILAMVHNKLAFTGGQFRDTDNNIKHVITGISSPNYTLLNNGVLGSNYLQAGSYKRLFLTFSVITPITSIEIIDIRLSGLLANIV